MLIDRPACGTAVAAIKSGQQAGVRGRQRAVQVTSEKKHYTVGADKPCKTGCVNTLPQRASELVQKHDARAKRRHGESTYIKGCASGLSASIRAIAFPAWPCV